MVDKSSRPIRGPTPTVTRTLLDTLDALADHVALLNRDGEVVGVNRAWLDFATSNGYHSGGTGLGTNYLQVCDRATGDHAAEARHAAAGIRQVLVGDVESFELEYPCHAPNEERWFVLSVRAVAQPAEFAAIVLHRSHTALHVAREVERIAHERMATALAESETDRRRLEATLEALPVGVWIANATGGLTHCNAAAARMWGGDAPLVDSPEEYRVYRAFHPDSGRLVEPEEWPLARTLLHGTAIDNELFEIARFDGARAHCLWTSGPIRDASGTMTGAVVVGVDVTASHGASRERDNLLATLEVERTRLKAIFEESPAMKAVMRGPNLVFERANPAYAKFVGDRQLIGRPRAEALPELCDNEFLEIILEVMRTGQQHVERRRPVRLARFPDGFMKTRYLDLTYQRLDDGHAEAAIIVHGLDVTDEVLATAALQQSEQRLRDQFAKLPVPTYLWEARGDDFVLLDFNDAARRANPALTSDSVGRSGEELYPHQAEIREEFRRCLRENTVLRRSIEYDAGFGMRTLDLTMGPQQPDRVLLHVNDITARRELESQLRQAQKMEAVGRLAGGIAHDFNNLLTVIGAHSSFLLESLDPADPRLEDAAAIHTSGLRAAGLTRQLLQFSRKQIVRPEMMDVNPVVAETARLLERLLTADIGLTTRLAEGLRPVVADAGQVGQMIMNLAVNARDAMPAGGTLTMCTSSVVVVAASELAKTVPPGRYTLIEVVDTGVGMDDGVKARLFEPFFTTKAVGEGTGLGLATVYGIVKQSAGHVTVDSAVGRGTTFSVYFPSVIDGVQPAEQRAVAGVVIRGAETVLLVEDEPAVRGLARRILQRHGYVVLEASNGIEASAVSDDFAAPIQLVVCDVVMPGLGGADVVRLLQQRRPGLKALFVSGYTEDEVFRRGIESLKVPFLQKPYEPDALARAVRHALEAPNG
ncbi:MAG: PAS domain-containing protein [Gemmatimonadaceae bacterium]|nr:PAS domain-containing protein [Gemmatimonadaceae bacterium]